MKKKVVIFLLAVMICSLFTSVSASSIGTISSGSNIVYQVKEITDENLLQNRMIKGITDDEEFKADCILSQGTILGDDGNQYNLKVKSVKATSQKIKEIIAEDGEKITQYSGNILATISMIRGGGDETLWEYDSAGMNVKLYVHVIYLSATLDTYPLYKITSLSGKLVKLDPSVYLTKIEVSESCFGDRYTTPDRAGRIGVGSYDNTATTNNPTSNTYYYNYNLSPYYWNMADGNCTYIKGITKGYFQRYGTQWSAQVVWER